MSGGGGDPHPPSDNSGGEFLLSLLQRPPSQQPQPQPQPQSFLSPPHRLFQQTHHLLHHQHQQNPNSLVLDPAVTAVGPSFPFAPHLLLQSDSPDLGFSHTASSHNTWQNSPPLSDDFSGLGYRNPIHDLSKFNQRQELDHKLQFGSFRNDGLNRDGTGTEVSLNANSNVNLVKERNLGLFRNDVLQRESREVLLNSANVNSSVNLVNERNLNLNSNIGNYSDRRGVSGRGKEHYGANPRAPPPGFKPRGRGGGSWDHGNRRKELESNVSRGKGNHGEFSSRNVFLNAEEEKFRSVEGFLDKGIARQLDRPGLPAGSNLHSVSGLDVEESFMKLEADGGDEGKDELDEVGEELVDSLLLDGEADSKKDKKQNRHPREDYRSDSRGQRILSQRVRMLKRQMECRRDIDRWNAPFLSIYNLLIPPEEEKAKQKQLLTLLETLVNKEWPDARLYLYGSCANSFGVLKSDIDVCLAIEDADVNKAEILTKLADILQSDNLQNVQALTRARVPIVKLMDPVTGISCDICINNILAVVNTKLLRDYAQIDERLRQLAFIVKHWAKSRGVNETYQGTLSSYAYVLMCIHFLQQRRPAILPCLQEMESTHSVIVDDIKCSFFDQVEKLHGFGSSNRETIAQLVWAFFNYWAYRHDYTNDVISVRTGSIISKREKEWTRRIGNDRHLICIEDPFETSHDLGRVVDKFSIRVLREEFERAAEIMQYDPNPCVTLFQPYVPT